MWYCYRNVSNKAQTIYLYASHSNGFLCILTALLNSYQCDLILSCVYNMSGSETSMSSCVFITTLELIIIICSSSIGKVSILTKNSTGIPDSYFPAISFSISAYVVSSLAIILVNSLSTKSTINFSIIP